MSRIYKKITSKTHNIIEIKEDISKLSIKVSVLSKELDMIKFIGSIAIGIIITGFSFLYNQINNVRQETNQVRQEMNAKFDKIDEKFDQKFDKLYDLIANKK